MSSIAPDPRGATDVQRFLNEHPFSRYQWVIFILCFLIVLMDGFDTAAIGFIAPSLITEWGIGKSALGPVLSAALLAQPAWPSTRSSQTGMSPTAASSSAAVGNRPSPHVSWFQPVPMIHLRPVFSCA